MRHDCPHCGKKIESGSLAVAGPGQSLHRDCGGAIEAAHYPEEFLGGIAWLSLAFIIFARLYYQGQPREFWMDAALAAAVAIALLSEFRLWKKQRYRKRTQP